MDLLLPVQQARRGGGPWSQVQNRDAGDGWLNGLEHNRLQRGERQGTQGQENPRTSPVGRVATGLGPMRPRTAANRGHHEQGVSLGWSTCSAALRRKPIRAREFVSRCFVGGTCYVRDRWKLRGERTKPASEVYLAIEPDSINGGVLGIWRSLGVKPARVGLA